MSSRGTLRTDSYQASILDSMATLRLEMHVRLYWGFGFATRVLLRTLHSLMRPNLAGTVAYLSPWLVCDPFAPHYRRAQCLQHLPPFRHLCVQISRQPKPALLHASALLICHLNLKERITKVRYTHRIARVFEGWFNYACNV